MTKIGDLLRFKKEFYFDGAVQSDWFYDGELRNKVSSHFVFHGPQYFGVTADDITFRDHKLMDTASFARLLIDKVCDTEQRSNFILAISPYGTGKSHMTVTLASLLSDLDQARDNVLRNITSADPQIGSELTTYAHRPNLVLVLNGMKDFNLNYEILSACMKSLQMHGVPTDVLTDVTRSYDIAGHFVTNNFSKFEKEFISVAKEELGSCPDNLEEYLISNLLKDPSIFEVINQVYAKITGVGIRWDDGISAGELLSKMADQLCGERAPFNKVVVMFDEFGRFLEFAAAFPARAGDAALQQIYESVQNSDGKIVFMGLIQSDLKSYLRRVERSSNIVRYVGRYDASEKVHLSSNLETIFANIIERRDRQQFNQLVTERLGRQKNEWENFHSDMMKWTPKTPSGVWRDWEIFSKTILEGTYPFHPFTTWTLTNLSEWLQQRSTLTFIDRELAAYSDVAIGTFGNLPFVPAISIVKSEFFEELLASEQDERSQSQYCMLYNQILIKHGDKIAPKILDVLAGNLVVRIGRLRTKTRSEAVRAIGYAAGLSADEVSTSITYLEDELGVLSFDETAGCFDFVADATGKSDFKRALLAKRKRITIDVSVILTNRIPEVLRLDENVETQFSRNNLIKTTEWKFAQTLVHIDSVTAEYVTRMIKDVRQSNSPDKAKGLLMWVYVNNGLSQQTVHEVCGLLREQEIERYPILPMLIDDRTDELYSAAVDYHIVSSFSDEERAKYARFIPEHTSKVESRIRNHFDLLAEECSLLTGNGISKMSTSLTNLCTNTFEALYTKVVPFPFDGFTNKTLGPAKKNLTSIARIVLTKPDFQWIHAQSMEVRNRLEAMLFDGRLGSWGVFNEKYQLISPTNQRIRDVFGELDQLNAGSGSLLLGPIVNRFLEPPYGMNEYIIALLIACYLAERTYEIRVRIGEERVRLSEWSGLVYGDRQVDFKILMTTVLEKIDQDAITANVLRLYTRIEQNNDIEVTPQLNRELKELESQEGLAEDVQEKLVSMRLILEEGLRLYDRYRHYFSNLRANLDKADSESDMKVYFEIMGQCQSINGYINGSTRYVFNSGQVDEANELITAVRTRIDERFESWFNTKLKCESVHQVTLFSKWARHLSTSFREYGYKEYARRVTSKIEDITDHLDDIARLQTLKETVNSYLTSCLPGRYSAFQDLQDWKDRGTKLLDLISQLTVHQSVSEYEHRVKKRVAELDQNIEAIREEIRSVYDRAESMQSISEAKQLILFIENLIKRSLKKTDEEDLIHLANVLQNFLTECEQVYSERNRRRAFYESLGALRTKWSSDELEVNCALVINSMEAQVRDELEVLSKQWVDRYLGDNAEVSRWSNTQCSRWLNETQGVPTFLSESVVRLLEQRTALVRNRLSELDIQGIVALFENLDENQKRTCLEFLSELVNSRAV